MKSTHVQYVVTAEASTNTGRLFVSPFKKGGLGGIFRRYIVVLLVCFTACLSSPSFAEEPAQLLVGNNPTLTKRMQTLTENLRCPVCQNESLASSHAPLAQDLRRVVLAQMEQGKSDPEILDFLIARYGDFIYYQPPFRPTTFLLWLGPFILLVGGGVGLFFYLRKASSSKNLG